MNEKENINVKEGTEGSVRSQNAVKRSEMDNKRPQMSKTPSVNSNVQFICIGLGQGGCKIMQTLASTLPGKPFQIAVNTSVQDLSMVNLPEAQKFKIGGINANGAGKNRNKAKLYYKNFCATNKANEKQSLGVIDTFLMLYEEVLFSPSKQNIIIVSFTSDGGSGSGLGPMFVSQLTNKINNAEYFIIGDKKYTIDDATNDIPRPVVIGLTPKCDVGAGSISLQNNIECFQDIQKSIDAGIGNFFIADNNLDPSVKYVGTDEKYKIINARITTPFLKFLGIELNSDIKCMDLQDKINALRIPGCSSFVSVTDKNIFQYINPRGQSVTRIVPMLRCDSPETQQEIEEKSKELIRKLDVTSVDIQPVFFDLDASSISGLESVTKDLVETSMIGFFGFNSLNSVVEDLRDNLHRTMAAADKKQDIIKSNSTGFNSIKEDSSELSNRFGANKGVSDDDVLDMF